MSVTQLGNHAGVTARQGVSTQNEVQTITSTATGGTFKLRSGNYPSSYVETAAIARNASAATVQTALRAVLKGTTPVTCTGGALGTNPVVCTFGGSNAGLDVPLLQVVNVDLSGGTVTVAATTAPTQGAFNDSDMLTEAAIDARLTAIDGTTFSAANLLKLTHNDKVYALRVLDNPNTI